MSDEDIDGVALDDDDDEDVDGVPITTDAPPVENAFPTPQPLVSTSLSDRKLSAFVLGSTKKSKFQIKREEEAKKRKAEQDAAAAIYEGAKVACRGCPCCYAGPSPHRPALPRLRGLVFRRPLW